jgi:hypothetical protein
MNDYLPAVAAVLCAGCSISVGYRGTGTLQWSGAGSPELASQQVVFVTCQGATRDRSADDEVTRAGDRGDPDVRNGESFSALGIGNDCWIDGRGSGAAFVPIAGRLCRLRFPEGDRVLRVTDFSAQYGQTSYITGRTYIDENHIEFALGGDDPETGRHALYRFVGTALEAPSAPAHCDDLRREREKNASGAASTSRK